MTYTPVARRIRTFLSLKSLARAMSVVNNMSFVSLF